MCRRELLEDLTEICQFCSILHNSAFFSENSVNYSESAKNTPLRPLRDRKKMKKPLLF